MEANGSSSRSPNCRGRPRVFNLVVWTFLVMNGFSVCMAAYDPFIFSFTRHSYNATISENVRGRAFVTPDEKMGIMMADPTLEVKYKITAGDPEKFFKADSRLVGDFCFLLIRTHTGNNDVLNRERRDVYILQVRATIKSRGQHKFNLRAKTQVYVTVLDTNDLSPLFHPTDYEVEVAEDAPLHTSVVRVSASDADIGINGEVYYSLDPKYLKESNQFAIHPTSGVVTLTRFLSYHDKPMHEFSVLAHDRGPKTSSSTARAAHVRVNVRQVNLHDPFIFVQHLPSVVEDSNVDVYAIVKVTDDDDGVHGQIDKVEILSGDDDGLFRMQKGSRPHEYNIAVLSFLDRETAPYGYNLTIRATDKGTPPRYTTKLVRVRVTDSNDHAPEFAQSLYETTVEEVAPIGTPILRISAYDTDVGRNALVRYKIVAGNDGSFTVDTSTGVLKVAKQLDAELRKEYELTLMATDQGNNGMRKNSTTKVIVSVTDNNDEDPVFVTSSSEVTLSENDPAGTVVFTARAVDSDQGENGYVSYSIANLSPTPFSVDHFTGEIRTREQLDYETQRRTYLLKVRASDWGSPYRRQTEMTLRVNLLDVNDNRPLFEKVDCVGQLYRRAPIRTPILTLSAVDFDSGNMITYLIVSGNEDRCFDLDSTTGVVTLACSLDDVKTKERYLNVTATDGLNFADEMAIKMTLVNRQTISFQCRDVGVAAHLKQQLALSEKNNQGDHEDVIAQMPIRYGANRHQPRFVSEIPPKLKVNESAIVGHKMGVIKAIDRDLGYNGQVVYVISDGDVDGCFQIDMYEGSLRVSAPLDRERRSVYRLNVTAWDLGRPQRGSWKAIQVEVEDVNDNPPVFDKAVHSVLVSEDIVNGSLVVRLGATDRDAGSNSRITYSLLTDTKDFAVDPVEGTVKVNAKLDREKHEMYELRVRATDGGVERAMSATAVVRVQLVDVNDNAPKFGMEQYSVRIREDVPLGAVLITLVARDPDLGAGGEVIYSLPDVSSDPDLPFDVDPIYGVVRVIKGLDFESRQMYNLSVRARDEGSPWMESTTYVLVEVMDVNENEQAPTFDDFVLMGQVGENKPPGTFVMQVEAHDEDDPWSNDGKVVYSIRDGDGLGRFLIDDQGNIYTSEVFDRETSKRYWLSVFAQDRGAVPLHSRVEVYVQVTDENDNVPLTQEAAYYANVRENSPIGQSVVKIDAYDLDVQPEQRLTYRITNGNTAGFFNIDSDTGLITTTGRRLDRELQDEHVLEVTVSDNGHPPLSSTTRVVVLVMDDNDHSPVFTEQLYRVRIPAMLRSDVDTSLFQVVAFDKDSGANADIDYTIKSGKGNGRFKINPKSGIVYSQKNFTAGTKYELQIEAEDNGRPRRSAHTRVLVEVIERQITSQHPPLVHSSNVPIPINEGQNAVHVTLVQADDPDGDKLWYSITDGNIDDAFMMKHETGEMVLIKALDWELNNKYNLTVQVTDGVHLVKTQVLVKVIDINNNRPEFSESTYVVAVSENIPVKTEMMELKATDKDDNPTLLYYIHSSINPSSGSKFHLDPVRGILSVAEKLDREACHQHVLTVMVKDDGIPTTRSNFARVVINVQDHNDHAPRFLADKFEGHVYETAALGSSVVQVMAVDADKGKNAEIRYTIVSGNIGGTFSIHETLGTITVVKALKLKSFAEYEYALVVKATDRGDPPLSSTVAVHVVVTMADNAPPKFDKREYSTEIYENGNEGSFVINVHALSRSTVYYEIIDGNEMHHLDLNPNSGVVSVARPIDYELINFLNLTLRATNMVHKAAIANLLVHVLDANDNAPLFLQTRYAGNVSEAAALGSLVMVNNSRPLAVVARDDDSELNALLVYEMVDNMANKYFSIDPNTGAIRTVKALDYEEKREFVFEVQVSDMGKPRLTAQVPALVVIYVNDVNDCSPVFEHQQYNASILMPTFKNVVVTRVKATDADASSNLKYEITNGNVADKFSVDETTGVLTVKDEANLSDRYNLTVRSTDGKFFGWTIVLIVVDKAIRSGLIFAQDKYVVNMTENRAEVSAVAVLTVLGNSLDEHLEFQILNPGPMFTIGSTSGVIWTKGLPFDRELKDSYTLIVEARSELEQYRVAQVAVYVNILDENDNAPIFINLPYFAIVPLDAKESQVILKVQAIDKDIGDNGEVRYELSDGDKELFRVNSKTGDLALRKQLHEMNHELQLLVTAYDRGMEPRHTDVTVVVRVISRSMPLFSQQYYSSAVPESIQPYSPVLSVQANSPEGRKLIYSIVEGNSREEFAVDFNTEFDRSNGPCVIYVVDQLDYEIRQSYQLKLQATDAVSGAHAQVLVSITVEDVNDNAPEFSQTSYTVNVLETAQPSTVILQLSTRDLDSGINKLVQYTLETERGNASEYFHIDPSEAVISIKSPLDREQFARHHFTVIATDSGVPALSSSTQVWVTVLDVNDNPPRFEQPTYHCFLSELATRGQFVTMVTAFDPDVSDQTKLIYTIVGGNDQQCFTINASTGIITLMSLHKFSQQSAYTLNVSVSDGVYTSFTRVKVDILSSNRHSPQFEKTKYEVNFEENQPEATLVTKLDATDEDRGVYGHITYDIQSDASKQLFRINHETGEIFSKKSFDREEQEIYEVPVVAVDGGGHSGYTLLRVLLSDVNDNAPKFRLGEYRANIHANMSIGTTILQVYATDDDDGANAMVEYSIYETNASETNTTDKFAVNRESGEIYLKRSALSLENQVYQFFIRARDFGKPSLENEVPVDIFIMGPQDSPPKFPQRANQFFVRENTPVRTVVTSLDAQTNDSVTYSLVSYSGDKEIFRIDEEGQLIVVGVVDREQQVIHTLTVRAQTESSPPLTAFTDITIQVMDENDNDPVFESNPYRVSVAENMAEGSTVLKVVAHDRDQGYRSGLKYSLDPASDNVHNVFAIDSATGWITTLVPLDRETTGRYSFGVVAKDNGNPVRSAITTIHVEVEDYNDNPPRFTQDVYRAAVNEDALIGTVVITVSTTDEDENLNSRVEYYLTAGDSFGHFQIQHTGEISVQKELDRESTASYRLEVTATDGTFVTTTLIHVEILDANDNPPVCKKVKYTERVSENVSVGSLILTIEATDRDEPHNARLLYTVSGAGSTDFTVDIATGMLKVAKPLDRETQSRYQLTAHVKDSDYSHWECTSEVEIFLSDINDNPPEFTQDIYSVTVPEDTEIRTLIGKVHATDRDLGVNRKVKYSFVDSAGGHFAIDNHSGLVTLAKSLDREQRALYNLTVKATDQGVPQLSSLAYLLVIVLDINDNPPEFASRIYHASITESASPGSDVVRVLATSRDSGVNAEITYSIVAGNEHGKFAIHPKTGVVTVVQALDYEKARDYYLTIQANDGGIPSLSNHATINITILDANDNSPIFTHTSYSSIVSEDALVGHRVLQVVATDLDSFANSRISYFIIKGDPHGHFHVDKQNGYISVQSPLDRETIASYKIEIQAQDDGVPNLSDTVVVNIDVSDANDNPPVFSLTNYSAIVQEDKPLGFTVLKLSVTDADTPVNGAPFTYKLVAGNDEQEFSITSDGILRTNSAFNHTIQDHYLLRIQVSDNGTPSLHSYAWVTIQIIEESRFRPIITPLDVTVNSYLDEFPGGVLGRIKATDEDPYDQLTFTLGRGYQHLFEIDSQDGTLMALAGLDAGTYQLNITVSDGKFSTSAFCKVVVHAVTEQMLEHALVIRFEGVTPETFIITYQRNFIKAVQNYLPVRSTDVLILSMQPAAHIPRIKRNTHQDLDVMFAVRRGEKGFYPKESVRKTLRDGKSKLELITELKVVKIYDNLCTPDRCVRGECRDRLVLDEMVVISVTTDSLSYVSPQHHHRVECRCQEGFGGEICDQIINECAKDPCPKNMLCIADSSPKGYFCQCQKGKYAPGCNDEENCVDPFCYKEKRPITFHGKSYARYTLVNPMDKRFSLKLYVRTSQPTGCLKYAAGRVDYSILEIVNGVVQYRFNCGSGEGIVRVEHVHINDRKWHEINLDRHGNKAELIVDGKSSSQGSTPGLNDVLNIDSNEIYFGAEVHPHPTIPGYDDDVRLGFVGCLDHISIDRIILPLFVSNGNSVATLSRVLNVDFQCSLSGDLGACGTQPCVNGGTCKPIESGTGFVCHCHTRFVGERCEVDTNPCASNPCLYGGTCSNLKNDFHCACPDRLSGKRCDYGRYCNPNPCHHNGVCEEGSHGAICKCRGFQGEFCDIDVDECAQNPCMNGGRCLNTVGSFVCECKPNATGALCDNLIVASGSITSSSMNITIEEIIGIVATVLILIILVLFFVAVRKYRAKRAAQRRLELLRDPPKDVILKNKTHDDLKRNSKLSNLEAPHTLMLPPRPASYTPSRHDSITALNNFDTVRSYGSAADDLENIPKYNTDFLQNITKNNTAAIPTSLPTTNQTPESESLHKPSWDLDHNLKESYPDNKIHNVDLKTSRAPGHNTTPSHHGLKNKSLSTFDPGIRDNSAMGRENLPLVEDTPAGHACVAGLELIHALSRPLAASPQANNKGYHWDCSDWARSQNPLPNITEVPTNEVPDSPSLHSNESNSRVDNASATPPVDMDSEYVGDSEYNDYDSDDNRHDPLTHPSFDELLSLSDVDFADDSDANINKRRRNYKPLHPDQYLPTYSIATDTENEDNGYLLQIDDDEPPPYTPLLKKTNMGTGIGSAAAATAATLDAMSMSLCDYTSTNASCSDLSDNLCEIEDSEVCSETDTDERRTSYSTRV